MNRQILFDTRKKLDEGNPVFNMGYEGGVSVQTFFENDTNNV